jgi:uncharacterized coiled-coil protein SlyX
MNQAQYESVVAQLRGGGDTIEDLKLLASAQEALIAELTAIKAAQARSIVGMRESFETQERTIAVQAETIKGLTETLERVRAWMCASRAAETEASGR